MNEHPPTSSEKQHGNAAAVGQSGWHLRRWLVLIAVLLFFALVMREVLDPFGSKGYVEISHGDHVHYVPEDRNPDVSISNFPTQPPGPNERITPEGRIVEH